MTGPQNQIVHPTPRRRSGGEWRFPVTIAAGISLTVAAFGIMAALVAPSPAAAQQTFDNGAPTRQLTEREQYCLRLEREMVSTRQSQSRGAEALPQLYAEQRRAEREFNQSQNALEQADCYEFFFFSRELRRTRRCVGMANQMEEVKQRLGAISREIADIRGAGSGDSNRRRQKLINELARNGCGDVYRQQARREPAPSFNPFGALFGRDSGSIFGGNSQGGYYDNAPRTLNPETGIVADATYRTVCVRLCDGYYFPVSYQTLPSRFSKDADVCQQRCAAPAELFVYRNPGAEVEQMISLRGEPYSKIPSAFTYRKQVVGGCSCHRDEYDPEKVAAATADGTSGTRTGTGGQRTASKPVEPPISSYRNPLGPGPVAPDATPEEQAATADVPAPIEIETPPPGIDQIPSDPDSVTIIPLEPLQGLEPIDSGTGRARGANSG